LSATGVNAGSASATWQQGNFLTHRVIHSSCYALREVMRISHLSRMFDAAPRSSAQVTVCKSQTSANAF